jgi:hypothetical protein
MLATLGWLASEVLHTPLANLVTPKPSTINHAPSTPNPEPRTPNPNAKPKPWMLVAQTHL